MTYVIYDAILDGEVEVLKYELANGADFHHVTANDKWTYLHKAFKSFNEKSPVQSIQFLIEQGLDVNAIDSYGNTPLIYAVRQRNVEGIRLLLENGADKLIEHENNDGVSALRMTLIGKPYLYDVIEVLLEFGANPDAKNPKDKTVRGRLAVIADVDPEIHALFKKY